MRKLFALILAVMVVMSLAVNASACTPRLKIPSIQIPKIKTLEVRLPGDFWNEYFRQNPFDISF